MAVVLEDPPRLAAAAAQADNDWLWHKLIGGSSAVVHVGKAARLRVVL
jgi:hypothetical protein